jgi:hypothetical protein
LNIFDTKYHFPLLITYLYVFFNSCFLPNGLYYTMILSPFFFYNAIWYRILKPFLIYLSIILLYFIAHYGLPINIVDYIRSSLLSFLNIAFLVNCYYYFNHTSDEQINSIFKKVVYLNFVLVGIAIVSFFIPFLKPTFWYLISITKGSGIVPRLKMFTSEASIYSLMLSPFFLYFFFYYLKKKKVFNLYFILLLGFPLVLSFSFGVMAGLLIAVLGTLLLLQKRLLEARTMLQLLFVGLLFLIGFAFWYYIDKENLVVLRLKNIISGTDTSAKGRTFESFMIAQQVLEQYDSWFFGIGPGQFKILGKELLLSFYNYSGNVSDVRIPNACADTLIVYGLVGLVSRILLQIFLFVKTKVYNNHYRFSLFLFLFIYQFTGSYFNNLIEWTIWVLVFSDAFKLFDKKHPILTHS